MLRMREREGGYSIEVLVNEKKQSHVINLRSYKELNLRLVGKFLTSGRKEKPKYVFFCCFVFVVREKNEPNLFYNADVM